MSETVFPIPKRSKVWTAETLEDPKMHALFEQATAQKIHRGRLLSKNPHCRYCGQKLKPKTATLDHVLPLSRGGSDDPENLVLACHPCNQCKGNRTPLEWASDILNGPSTTS